MVILSHGNALNTLSFPRWSILLIEADAELCSSRELLLESLYQPFDSVLCYRDLCALPPSVRCCVAALSISRNKEEMYRIAAHVSTTWPVAKIFLLGGSAEGLKDYLYDEIVNPYCDPSAFVTMARELVEFVCICNRTSLWRLDERR